MRTELEQTLDHLLAQLEAAETLDLDERERLRQAIHEIQGSLDRQEVSSHSLADRLAEGTRHFQESHPSLTQSIGRIADMLAQMGI